MSNIDRIIENVNATMSMENMPLLDSDKERIRKCLEGQIDFEETIKTLINKYRNKQVV